MSFKVSNEKISVRSIVNDERKLVPDFRGNSQKCPITRAGSSRA